MSRVTKYLGAAGFLWTAVFAASSGDAKDITLGYAAPNLAWPYVEATKRGFEAEAKAAGVKTVVLNSQGSVEKLGNNIDDLIAQKVDGIGFLPLDSVVAQTSVDKIAEANIPVVAISIQVGDPAKRKLRDVYPKLSALVTTDDILAGERAGEMALKTLPKDHVAKIAIIEGMPGAAVSPQRIEGFRAALDKAKVKYQIVASQPTDWTPEKGEAVCQNILTANPDVDLFFSVADDMAIGCSRALKSSGSNARLLATAGGSRMGYDAIKSGAIDGSVCTRPELIGRLMFKTLYAAVQNPKAPKGQFITYDIPAIQKDNLSDCPVEW